MPEAETVTEPTSQVPADPWVTLEARDVHVRYWFGTSRIGQLRDLIRPGSSPQGNYVHAVRGVSLTARSGESIALIGRNGAGKSTLLRAMAGLLPVSSGDVRAVSVPVRLGVGSALQPRLPGRDNIILGGLAMGQSREEMVALVPKIAEFAGITDAIDRPMNTYSSGMRARLHFAVATTVAPEILMVDEALAVGDEAFKRASRRRLREIIDDAGTVFVVSHSLQQLRRLCTRGVWLNNGVIEADGDVPDVVREYRAFVKSQRG